LRNIGKIPARNYENEYFLKTEDLENTGIEYLLLMIFILGKQLLKTVRKINSPCCQVQKLAMLLNSKHRKTSAC
jgi:hypothetical protein